MMGRAKWGAKQSYDPKPPAHSSNMVMVLLWLGLVERLLKQVHCHLLMVSLLTEAAGWIQRYAGAFCAQFEPNASKLNGWHFIIQQNKDPWTYSQSNQRAFQLKRHPGLVRSQSPDPSHEWAAFHSLRQKDPHNKLTEAAAAVKD